MSVRVRDENINTPDFWDETWQVEPEWNNSFGIDPGRYEALAAPARAEMRVLDVGGGRGEFLNWLGPEQLHRTLFDQSRVAIEYATNNGWADECIVGDCSQPLPFADRSFDAVYCCEVLEHIDNPATLIGELRRVSNGYVAISTPLRNTPDDKQHVWSFEPEDIAGLLSWGDAEISLVGNSIVAVIGA